MYFDCIFSNDDTNSERLSDKIITFSYTELTDEPSFLHSHQYAEIMLVSEGVGELVSGKERLTLKKGTVYIINPNTEHTEFQKNGLKYFVIKLKNFTFYDKRKHRGLNTKELSEKEYNELLSYFSSALGELRSLMPYNKELARELLGCAYVKILRLIEDSEHFINRNEERASSSRLQAIIDYISLNHNKDLKIEEITDRFSISHNTLIRLFKKHLSTSPKKFIINMKIETAKAMLKNSDLEINLIAYTAGFTDDAYFAKIFKSATGITPSEYRKTRRKTKSFTEGNT